MEAKKVAYGAKSIVLDNGVELTYCELGEQNEEVLVTGAFYFHTVMPVVELLAERYHVYGVVMRFDGDTDELDPDGSTNWTRQWGADVYRFAKANTFTSDETMLNVVSVFNTKDSGLKLYHDLKNEHLLLAY